MFGRLLSRPTSGAVRRLADDRGFTLVEVLLVVVLSLIVLGAIMAFVVSSLWQESNVSSRAASVRQGELVVARLTRELRQAQHILDGTGANTTPVNVTYGSGSSSVSFYLPDAGSTTAGTQVTWTCSANGSCTRTAGGATVTELRGVQSATFTPIASDGSTLASNAGNGQSPSFPSSVEIALQLEDISQLDPNQSALARGVTNPITLHDGVELWSYGA